MAGHYAMVTTITGSICLFTNALKGCSSSGFVMFILSVITLTSLVLASAAAVEGRRLEGPEPSLELLLDVDTGVDDALAIILATTLPHVRVDVITTVAGNADLGTVYNNTLRALKVINRTDIPVYKGAEKPISGFGHQEEVYYGPDNFGGVSALYPMGENSARGTQKHAALRMIEIVKERPGRMTMVIMGPLTNLATALLVEPDFLDNVQHVYILGGDVFGKTEFNFVADPEAIMVALQRSSCAVTLVPWDVAVQATVPWDTYYSVTNKTGPLPEFLRDTTSHTVQCCLGHSPGFSLGDFMAVLAATVQESITLTTVHRADVELHGTYTRGQLVLACTPDMLPHVTRNITIVERFNVTAVEEYFKRTFDPDETSTRDERR
ncbi:nucleoside hydrolase-like [Haemaphysalis longicornis]